MITNSNRYYLGIISRRVRDVNKIIRIRGNKMIYFQTERLILRDWKQADIEPFICMNQNEEVMRYFPKTLTKEQSLHFIEKIQAEFDERGHGLYAVEERESEEFIGYIGLHQATFDADFTPCTEIGWRLKRDAWGKGYATEAAKACLSYGFDVLDLKTIYSFTAKINQPSRNVMNKIGMSFIKEFNHPNLSSGHSLERHVLFSKSSTDEFISNAQSS